MAVARVVAKAKPREMKEIIGGRPVDWAKEPVVIAIREEDVEDSIPGNHLHCAIATACRRNPTLFDGLQNVIVRRSRAWLVFGPSGEMGQVVKYMLPQDLKKQVAAFDDHGEFETGEYRLMPPNPSRLGQPTTKKQTSRKGIKNVKAKKAVRSMPLRSIDLKRNTGGYPTVTA